MSFKNIIAASALSLSFAVNASATSITYILSGTTNAPVTLGGAVVPHLPENQNKEFQLNWDGVRLIHDLGANKHSAADDVIRLQGTVSACVGNAGASCFGSGDFERIKVRLGKPTTDSNQYGLFEGAGEFRFKDTSFTLDAQRSTEDDLYANMQAKIGLLVLLDQKLGRAEKVNLSLKQHPGLDYAFRLFNENGVDDGLFTINTWLQSKSWLFSGTARSETRKGESVFNGSLSACRIGASCDGEDPGTEVPEPASALLLGAGLLGAMRRSKSRI